MNENKLNGQQDFIDEHESQSIILLREQIGELHIVISAMGKVVEDNQKELYKLRGRVDKMEGI